MPWPESLLSDDSEFQQCLERETPDEWLHYHVQWRKRHNKWVYLGKERTEDSSLHVEKRKCNAHPGVYLAFLGRFSLSVQEADCWQKMLIDRLRRCCVSCSCFTITWALECRLQQICRRLISTLARASSNWVIFARDPGDSPEPLEASRMKDTWFNPQL